MKKTFLFLLLSFTFSTFSFSQLPIDSFYVNKSERLIYSKVHNLDSLSSDEIVKKVKEWGGVNFANMNNVLVSETSNQLVFNYITSDFYVKTQGMKVPISWYIRLVVQIKDNKVRMLFYDDGNGLGQYKSPRTYFLNEFFKDDISKNFSNDGLINLKKSCEKTLNILIVSLLNKNKSTIYDNW